MILNTLLLAATINCSELALEADYIMYKRQEEIPITKLLDQYNQDLILGEITPTERQMVHELVLRAYDVPVVDPDKKSAAITEFRNNTAYECKKYEESNSV